MHPTLTARNKSQILSCSIQLHTYIDRYRCVVHTSNTLDPLKTVEKLNRVVFKGMETIRDKRLPIRRNQTAKPGLGFSGLGRGIRGYPWM